ncbi:MAG: hypothetical protein IPO09_14095 [Anaeromyxobacter sp.]|nr:hypothetical protein [Anaeromyxobacter sp.]MBL0275320.1 hypothetical protein [Anaeromyxobacter sp.]
MLHVFRLLHVLSVASWLAASLWLAGDARRSLAAGAPEALAFVGRARAAVKLDKLAAILVIVTGLALIHFAKAWPLRGGLWLGIVLATVRAGLTDAVLAPSLKKIAAGLQAGQAPAELLPVARRMALVSGLGHVAWLGALAGMVLPF